MIEKAILFTNERYLRRYNMLSDYKRVYFGNEFCQTLIPAGRTIRNVLKYINEKGLHFTFLTPFVTDEGLRKLSEVFKLLLDRLNHVEVVINDWGVLDLINERYKLIQPVLGRLMFRQKRDPRVERLIRGGQKAKIVTDEQGRKTIFLPKEIPADLKEAYTQTNVDFYLTKDFLLQNRIKRIEFDNLLQGLSLRLPKDISASLYFPYGYIAITRYCSSLTSLQEGRRIGYCKKWCDKYFLKLRSPCMPKVIYKKGNTQFYKNTIMSIRNCENQGINRLIYEPELPI